MRKQDHPIAHTPAPAETPRPTPIPLTETDYENLWLRIKDKYWKNFWGSMAIVAVFGAFSGYQIARSVLEDSASKYVQTDEFKARIARYTMESLPEYRKSLEEIEQREGRLTIAIANQKDALDEAIASRQKILSAMTLPPISVAPGTLTFASADGKRIRIDYGSFSSKAPGLASAVGGHTFTIPFETLPVVIITPANPPRGRYTVPYGIGELNKEGFNVVAEGSSFGGATIHWIAIGE